MIIQDLHQPFVFEQNSEIKIITSQIQVETLSFNFGEDSVIENYWKLKLIDVNGNITNINTPDSFTIGEVVYNVIAECNGFLYENRLSYIVGLHTRENNDPLYLFLVVGDFNFDTNTVTNINIVSSSRTGYVKINDIYQIDFINSVLKINQVDVFNYSEYIDSTSRIIGVHNENKTIITGYKGSELVTYVYSLDDQTFNKLKNDNDNDIYKSSYYGDPINGVLSYAIRTDLGGGTIDYKLYIETGYVLTPIT